MKMNFLIKSLGSQTIYTFCIVILSIRSLTPQYLIYRNPVIFDQLVLYGAFVLMFVSLVRNKKLKLKIKKFIPFFSCLFLYSLIELVAHGELWISNTNNICLIVLLVIFYMLSYEDKIRILSCMFVLLTILLVLAYFEYILYKCGVSFIIQSGIERGEGSGAYYSHGIFNVFVEGKSIVRFQSLLREPGFLGMIAGLFMFVLPKVNKKLWLLWIIFGISSMSLAYFILFLASLLFVFSSGKGKELFVSIVVIILILIVALYFFPHAINDIFLSRIVDYTSRGYDNRSTDYANTLLSNANSFNKWFGYSESFFYKQDMGWGTTGIKMDLIKWGYLGVFLSALGVFTLFKTYIKKNKYMLFVIMMLFLILYYNGSIKYMLCMHLLFFSIYDANTNKLFFNPN